MLAIEIQFPIRIRICFNLFLIFREPMGLDPDFIYYIILRLGADFGFLEFRLLLAWAVLHGQFCEL